jgi:leader peptidase (prepilin peptidase) / N-methyltransferase
MTGEEQGSVFSAPGINGRAMETLGKKNRTAYAVFAVTGSATALASLFAAPGREGIFGAALALFMAAIAVVDARSFIIPDRLTLAAFALGLVNAAGEDSGAIWENVANAAARGVALGLAFYVLRAVYSRLRGRQGIGLGDVKLAAAAGIWLDWTLIPIAIEIAALAALASYALRQLFKKRPIDPRAKLPFGLFFAPAIWLCWLADVTLLKRI